LNLEPYGGPQQRGAGFVCRACECRTREEGRAPPWTCPVTLPGERVAHHKVPGLNPWSTEVGWTPVLPIAWVRPRILGDAPPRLGWERGPRGRSRVRDHHDTHPRGAGPGEHVPGATGFGKVVMEGDH